jgi:hypothetical protein
LHKVYNNNTHSHHNHFDTVETEVTCASEE